MYVEVKTVMDPTVRTRIVKRRSEFESSPDGFVETYSPLTEAFRQRIGGAQWLLSRVTVPREVSSGIAAVCAKLRVDGVRGDIVVDRAARAFAALMGLDNVCPVIVGKVIRQCLRHRIRSAPGCDLEVLMEEAFFEAFQVKLPPNGDGGSDWVDEALQIPPAPDQNTFAASREKSLERLEGVGESFIRISLPSLGRRQTSLSNLTCS
jgi:magnesium chelatase subunit I